MTQANNPQRGVVARKRTHIATIALACSLFAAPAFASRPHQFKEVFGEPCIALPCEGAQLKSPDGVAVNEATGDVYVVDQGANRVARFSAAGVFESEFDGSGLHGEGVAAGGKEPKEPGEVETGRFVKPESIAVDNSCVLRKRTEPGLTLEKCVEQDPSNGDVYVADVGNFVIDKYTAAGEYVGQITEDSKGPFFHTLMGVAVDEKGRVWLYQAGQTITEYSNATPNALGARLELHLPEFPGFSEPGFAVDGKGDFYARYLKEGGGGTRIAELDPSGKTLNPEVSSENTSSVAADQTNDNVLLDNLTSVALFDSTGTFVERLGEEGGAKHLAEGAGVGVNGAAGSFYVADPGVGGVVVFGPSQPSAPKVEAESFSQVTSDSADLAAVINPHSEPKPEEGNTTYRFQYGRCPTIDPASCVGASYEDVPGSAGVIAPDFEGHPVTAELHGLQAGATYHFRAVASNVHGEGAPGEEDTFTTEAAGGTVVLPDDRGWELVSPPDKLGAQIEPLSGSGVIQAAGDGGGITYLANTPTEAQPQGYDNKEQVLSSRGAASWSSRDLGIPHTEATGASIGEGWEHRFFSQDLSESAVQPFGPFNPALSAQASEATAYLRDLGPSCGSECFRPLVTGKPGFANVPEATRFGEDEKCEAAAGRHTLVHCGPRFTGASDDLSHVVLESNVPLKTSAGVGQMYEWAGGALAQVSILPGQEPSAASSSTLGAATGNARRAVSSDGSRIVWTSTSNLYLRDMTAGTDGETVQLDQTQAGCGACEPGGGRFQIASADGSRVFFTDGLRLTEDSAANAPGEADLYECRIVLEAGKLHCQLTDLTPRHGSEGANVQGSVLGASEDGSYVYFVANGVQSETPNSLGQSPVAGQPNLYVRHEATTSFITTLAGDDEHVWGISGGTPVGLIGQPMRVSDNGRFVAFMAQESLTGYDNRDRATGKPVAEVYLYDATTNRLSCASCEPTGARPTGIESIKLEPGSSGGLTGGNDLWEAHALVAANVPGWTAFELGTSRYQPRYLSDSGRLFFNSADALVPQDSNRTEDVYEYEPPGVGGCTEALSTFSARSGGCVSLISSGSSAQESAFLDASETGDDVFFLTSAKLSPLDVDNAVDVYDAHRCTSSLPCITFPDTQVPPCTTEASCKPAPTPQPSIFADPASATFQGPGNLTPAPPPPAKHKTAAQVRAEKLKKALKACKKDKRKHKRTRCERAARGRYAAHTARRYAKARKARR